MTFVFDMMVVRAFNSSIGKSYDDYSFWVKQSRIEIGARVGNSLNGKIDLFLTKRRFFTNIMVT